MTKRETLLIASLGLLVWLGPPKALAQSGDGSILRGSAQIGFRSVDVSGRDEKYREDINLEDGPRLFHFGIEYTPPRGLRRTIDKVEIDAHNLGGDPYEVLRVAVKKFGRYCLEYDRRKSSYFYDDIILPSALSDTRLSNGGDFHSFDFDRVRDSGTLAVHVSSAAKLTVGFDRFTRKGSRTTTLDLQRDEFEMETPVDESMNEYLASLQYSWKKVTLALEERVRQYDNAVQLFLPGRSLGADAESATYLDYFFLDRPYDLTGLFHTAHVIANPNARLTIRGEASINDLSLDLDVSERAEGTDYQGNHYSTDTVADGTVERNLALYDVDASYLLTDRLALLAGARRHEMDQDGELSLGRGTEQAGWEIDTTSADIGLRMQASRSITLSGGLRHERRDVASSSAGEAAPSPEERDTQATGAFFSVGWRASSRFRVRAGYEDDSYDGPFTLAAPTSKRIVRVRGQYGGGGGFSVSGSLRLGRSKNSDSGWRDDHDIANLRVGYRKASFSASAGYSLVRIDRSIDQQVAGIDLLVPVAYDVSATSVDARLIWSFAERWKVGGHARRYDGTGTFEIRRDDFSVWLESLLGSRYVVHLGLRAIAYDEPERGLNDYDATIVETSLGYQW